MKSFLVFILFFQISVDKLIESLGNNEYQIRKNSYDELKKLEFAAISKIVENFDNKDIEISLSCRRLYDEYLYLTDDEGEIPNIWYLSIEDRFPEGCEVSYTEKKDLCYIETKKDLSLYYFEKFRSKHYFYMDCCCYEAYCYCFSDYSFYKNEEIGKLATKIYIKDYLLNGGDKKKLKEIIRKASSNMKNFSLMYQTSNLKEKKWDFWNMPPGVLVLKEKFIFPTR